jgi:hypothetical protein
MGKEIIGAQGEITIIRIDAIPAGAKLKPAERAPDGRGWIVSHSESGHHHVLDGGEVMERTDGDFVTRLYATLTEPARLLQTAAAAHEPYVLPPGVYEFRLAREYDPFSEQARRVAD